MGYYYLASQLPALIYGQGVPMSSAAFKDLCRGQLSAFEAALLDYCTLDPDAALPAEGSTASDFINQWRNWERALRLNLARFRAQQLKRDISLDPPEYPADAVAAAKAALGAESPLEAELLLDQARWNAIGVLQGIDYFSIDTIYAYLLKLLLMERYALFRPEEGFAEYKGLYAAILAAAGGNESNEIEPGEPK